MSQSAELNLNLHPKQGTVLQTKATETLFGGAAGGGKSFLIRAVAILWCASIPGLQVYLFRRIRDDLIKNHMEGPKGFRVLLAPWVLMGWVKIVEDEIRFWNGSRIYLCHCKDEKDIYKYQGAEMHVLLIDELTHFTETMYRFLRNRVRMVGIELPAAMAGLFPRIVCGANPGNIGHAFVKAMFVDLLSPLEVRRMPKNEGGMLRQFVPARLEDNPSMVTDDPDYEARLEGLGSEALVRAMRWGDWDILEGAFFDCWPDWKRRGGILKPFVIPQWWAKYRSFDWGSARPFSTGWWAVASEPHPSEGGVIPRGALIRYREWYGVKRQESGEPYPDVGLKMSSRDVGAGIIERTPKDERIVYTAADPSIFTEDGRESIETGLRRGGVSGLRKANNRRRARGNVMGGWDMLRERFLGEDVDGSGPRPMVYMFDTCRDSARTIPILQHDSSKPEDLDTDMEDHAIDDWRYMSTSRPYMRPRPAQKKAIPRDYAKAYAGEVDPARVV